MAQSVTRRIERSLTASAGFRSRPTDKASICGNHQGQRSCEIAPKGRTHDCKRPVLLTKKALASWGPSTHEATYSGRVVAVVAEAPAFARSGREAPTYAAVVPPTFGNSGEGSSQFQAWHRATPFEGRVRHLTCPTTDCPQYVKSSKGCLVPSLAKSPALTRLRRLVHERGLAVLIVLVR